MSLRLYTRKHIRLREFDYSSVNPYFITICTKRFVSHFGEINNGFICLNPIGSIAYQYLMKIAEIRNRVTIGEAIVMPNHVHCILNLKNSETRTVNSNQFGKPVPYSVSVIVNQYKSAVKKWCDSMGYPDFEWQGRFHDHVVRDSKEYWLIKNYIMNNPRNWQKDKFCRNPS